MRRAFVPLPNYNNFLFQDGRKRRRAKVDAGLEGRLHTPFLERRQTPDAEKIKFTFT